MRNSTQRSRWPLARCASWVWVALVIGLAPVSARAQNIISVPFTKGFIGTRGSSAGTANNVLTYTTLGIARTFFIQNSSSTTFELQGNDIPGTLRIVRTDGSTLDIPASANWRNSGGTTYLIGILPRPVTPITFTYGGGSIQITDGSSNGGSSVGGYSAAYAGATLADGESTSGNAAQSQVLNGLNAYLATVLSSRPSGPVTVATLSTSDNTPTLTGTATLQSGENLTVVVNGVQYSTSTSPALSVSGGTWSLTLTSSLAAGSYDISATITNADGFTLSDATTNELTIAPAVTIGGSFTANNKEYTGTTAATGVTTGLTLSGVAGGDNVTIASVTLAFGTAGVEDGKTVSIVSVTLGGTNAGSYTVDLTGAPTATANITTRALTISGVSAQNKVYDRSNAATLSGTAAYVGLQNGESFVVTGTPAATFADPNVANGIAVSVSGYTAPSANYSVTQPASLTANITQKTLTVSGTFTAPDKPYDGTTSSSIATNNLTVGTVETGDDVSIDAVVVAFGSAGVGSNKTVSITSLTLGGSAAGNYQISLTGAPTTTASITSSGPTLTLGGTFTASNKTYDRTLAATGNTTGLTLVGVNGGDEVNIASVTLAFTSATVGTGKSVEITSVTLGGAQAGTYALDLTGAPSATANITPAELTIGGSFTANNKSFDGNTSATIATNSLTLTGVIAPDAVSLTGVTAAFGTASVGNGKSVGLSAASLTGAAAGNYTVSLTGSPTTTANILGTPTVTIGGAFTAFNKVYSGTVAATGNTAGLTLSGVNSPDEVTISTVTLAFQSATVGTGKSVVITGVTLAGAQGALYAVNLAGAPTTTANITPRPVTIGGSFTARDKTFDGNTSAQMVTNALTVEGAVNGEQLSLGSVSIAFATEVVGPARLVSIQGADLLGTTAGNYVLSLDDAPTTTASIRGLEPPGMPRTLLVTPGDGSLSVTWTLPSVEGCEAITGFALEHSSDDGATWTRIAVNSRVPGAVSIAPVANNLTYRVRVAAINSCGMSGFAEATPVTPTGPAREGNGGPRQNGPGTNTVTRNGTDVPVTTTVVADTVLLIMAPDFTLQVRSADTTGAPVPPDSLTLQLEHGGTAFTSGTGFAPSSWVSLYIYGLTGTPRFLGKVQVDAGGNFATSVPIPSDLAEGNYTLQVNGVDTARRARTATLGVQVVEPLPDLVLASVPDRTDMTVGDTVTFALTVTNTGRGAATDVVIPRAFSEPGFRFVSATPVDGSYDATTGSWTIPRIAAGGVARLTLRAVVLAPSSSGSVAP